MAPPSAVQNETLGQSASSLTQHSIITFLPSWRDNVAVSENDKRVVDSVILGYPRFWTHPSVRKLASICGQKFGVDGEACMLFPSRKIAAECRTFILNRAALAEIVASVRLVEYTVCSGDSFTPTRQCAELHIAFFSPNLTSIAKEFWQYTGVGISSRFAEHCLSLLSDQDKQESESLGGESQRSSTITPSCMVNEDQRIYLEGHGQNLPLDAGAFAKHTLRKRIARLIVTGDAQDGPQDHTQDVEGVEDVSEDDVFLFQSGMVAIWNAHQLFLRMRPPSKCVCFGFLNHDTLMVLEKWGPGVHFFGHGHDSDVDALERLLAGESSRDPARPPILALFTEFPSNPLLQSVDMARLRALADAYDFLLVVDDTVGNFVNVEILPYADIVVTSLSKIFSGSANVLGGSLVLNPRGRHYAALKSHLSDIYEDTYFGEDAVVMERNSRDFTRRVRIIDENAQAVSAYLRTRQATEGAPSAVIKEVFYPTCTTPAQYLRCKRPHGGYGGLFSLIFTSIAASSAFFDALNCHKGAHLGTNFTLACPLVALAFRPQLEWAARYGAEEALVRISVGMEDRDWIIRTLDAALEVAESTQ